MMTMQDLQYDLDQVKRARGTTQLELFETHKEDAETLALQGETLANTLRVIELREPAGAVSYDGMRKAFYRAYGSWALFKEQAASEQKRAAATAEDFVHRSSGIRDDRVSGKVWGGQS